ncbi:hypothetical protein JW752_05255 [Candidatus Peregrinibacteria bacterium]|nr:hypothetical protein [Candidatus Peregrinibacteria bacterium]
MERLLTLQYYFTPRPDPDFRFTKITLALIVLFFVAAVGVRYYRKKVAKDPIIKKMIKRYPGKLMTFGTLLLFLLLVREAGIPFVSMRFLWFALLLYVVCWAAKILLNFKKDYRRRIRQVHTHAERAKYLPKRKK